MNHSFNVEIAKIYGVDEAIIIENLYFWIAKNKANDKHFYDGKYWTYNSVKAFAELLPYWTDRQIERIIKSLSGKGAITIGNYNKKGYDRTKWYSLTQTVESIYANGGMQLREPWNGNTQTVEPIPDINTFINTVNKADKPTRKQIPPSFKEVEAYCKERNKGVDPNKWYDHYTANGWMVGRTKMKDWQAAVRKWENSTYDKPKEEYKVKNFDFD